MTEKDPTPYPSVIVTDAAGSPPGCVSIHNQATGTTIVTGDSQAEILQGIRDSNK